MKREDICKDKLDRKEPLTDIEKKHYIIRRGHKPVPKLGFASEDEIFYCGLHIQQPIERFHRIEKCPLCHKLHLYKKTKE